MSGASPIAASPIPSDKKIEDALRCGDVKGALGVAESQIEAFLDLEELVHNVMNAARLACCYTETWVGVSDERTAEYSGSTDLIYFPSAARSASVYALNETLRVSTDLVDAYLLACRGEKPDDA